MRTLLVFVISVSFCLPIALADEPITPDEAAKKVGDTVTVKMEIKSSATKNGNYWLNSEVDHRSSENFTIFINVAAAGALKEAGVDDPSQHYQSKTVHVTGVVSLFRDKPQIAINGPDDIKLVQ